MKEMKKMFGIFAMAGIIITSAFTTGCSDDSDDYYSSGDLEYTLAEETLLRGGEGGNAGTSNGHLSFNVAFEFKYKDNKKDSILYEGTASFEAVVDTSQGACTLFYSERKSMSPEFENVTLDGVCLTSPDHYKFEATAYHLDFDPMRAECEISR